MSFSFYLNNRFYSKQISGQPLRQGVLLRLSGNIPLNSYSKLEVPTAEFKVLPLIRVINLLARREDYYAFTGVLIANGVGVTHHSLWPCRESGRNKGEI